MLGGSGGPCSFSDGRCWSLGLCWCGWVALAPCDVGGGGHLRFLLFEVEVVALVVTFLSRDKCMTAGRISRVDDTVLMLRMYLSHCQTASEE